eukprot:TRINITY_DN2120_c0_g1_i1.p1 TRINITY_DN2120_c0_g1~~TRINITY_DN2120_c0_g1_i1.p1  ORF type:complete len:432 (-),score=124.68 TRINITY_DN2120_c0_g1_i1:130-1425(-)
MLRQASSRNHRSKGFKVKHALQLCLLLAVCVWLLYQVKHSHDKKKAFDESHAKALSEVENSSQILKLGRKDLNDDGLIMVSEKEKPIEEEGMEEVEDEGRQEDNEVEDDNKQEDNEAEEGGKQEEVEDEGRGDGDDEIDEHDQDRSEEEAEQGEDFVDEVDKENEEKEDLIEETGSSENQDLDGGDRDSQEAREEHYKGDDASSAVLRETQMINNEVENGILGNPDEENVDNTEKKDLESDTKTNRTEDVTIDGNGASPNPSINATIIEEKATEVSLSKLDEGSHPNLTITPNNDQLELHNNSTAENAEIPGSSLQDETVSKDSTIDRNATVEMETSVEDNNKLQIGGVPDQSEKSNTTAGSDESSTMNVNTDENSVLRLTTNENTDASQIEPTDSSESLVTQEEKDARIDLGTLPETEHEGKNTEELSTE